MSFPLLSTCTDEVISISKMTFLPTLTSGNGNSEHKLNPALLPLYPNLSRLAFLANLATPSKQFFKVKS